MKLKNILILSGIIILIIGGLAFYSKTLNTTTPQVCINSICFDVEIAKTPAERQQGLMYRKSLGENSGMLFVFEQENTYGFWMKNTLIPLDMIRINNKNEIVDIKEAEPCTQDPCPSYTPQGAASFVLEINQGLSQKYGFKQGNKTKIKK